VFGRGINPDQKTPSTAGSPANSSLTPPLPPNSRDFQASSSTMMTPSKPASVIGADLAIVGQKITLVCKSALIVAGEVSGDIHGDDVTVGETGKVNGTVSARNLSIHGEVNGQLRGETVALYATARINGDIVQKHLVIAEGAQFDGRVRSAKDASDWEPILDADTHRSGV
jgi:cytoskeletal protein CcmA (bactofilin family)